MSTTRCCCVNSLTYLDKIDRLVSLWKLRLDCCTWATPQTQCGSWSHWSTRLPHCYSFVSNLLDSALHKPSSVVMIITGDCCMWILLTSWWHNSLPFGLFAYYAIPIDVWYLVTWFSSMYIMGGLAVTIPFRIYVINVHIFCTIYFCAGKN